MSWTIIIVIAVIILTIFILTRKLPPDKFSNWNQLIDGMQYSTQKFYDLVEADIKSHKVEELFFERVSLSEGTYFSAKRIYLRIQWREYTYDIGAFRFGSGFYVTSWQYQRILGIEALLVRIPIVGFALHRLLFPVTYFTIDSASMFLTYVHHSVTSTLDTICKEQGVRLLSETERKPNMDNVFKRK